MQKNDFNHWLDYHRKAYPALSAWLKANDGQLDFWERILSGVELHHAKSATDAMATGDEQPKGYGEHPRWIRRIAMSAAGGYVESYEKRQEGPRVKDDVLVADCWRCMDFGIVSVLSPLCLKRMWKDDRSKHLMGTCVVACDCQLGERKSRNLRIPRWKGGHALFPLEKIIDTAIEEIHDYASFMDAEWVVARRMLLEFDASRHVHPDFAEYA